MAPRKSQLTEREKPLGRKPVEGCYCLLGLNNRQMEKDADREKSSEVELAK